MYMSIQLNKLAVEDLEILLDVYRDNSKKTNEIKKIMKQKDIENGGLRYDKNTNRIYNLKFEAINKKESNKIKKSEISKDCLNNQLFDRFHTNISLNKMTTTKDNQYQYQLATSYQL